MISYAYILLEAENKCILHLQITSTNYIWRLLDVEQYKGIPHGNKTHLYTQPWRAKLWAEHQRQLPEQFSTTE